MLITLCPESWPNNEKNISEKIRGLTPKWHPPRLCWTRLHWPSLCHPWFCHTGIHYLRFCQIWFGWKRLCKTWTAINIQIAEWGLLHLPRLHWPRLSWMRICCSISCGTRLSQTRLHWTRLCLTGLGWTRLCWTLIPCRMELCQTSWSRLCQMRSEIRRNSYLRNWMAKKEGPKVCANSRIFFLIDNWAYFTIIKKAHQIMEVALHIANPSSKMGIAHNSGKKKKLLLKPHLILQ